MYAEIVGYGATDDAHHMTAPDPEGNGGARAIRMAYEEAGADLCKRENLHQRARHQHAAQRAQ